MEAELMIRSLIRYDSYLFLFGLIRHFDVIREKRCDGN